MQPTSIMLAFYDTAWHSASALVHNGVIVKSTYTEYVTLLSDEQKAELCQLFADSVKAKTGHDIEVDQGVLIYEPVLDGIQRRQARNKRKAQKKQRGK